MRKCEKYLWGLEWIKAEEVLAHERDWRMTSGVQTSHLQCQNALFIFSCLHLKTSEDKNVQMQNTLIDGEVWSSIHLSNNLQNYPTYNVARTLTGVLGLVLEAESEVGFLCKWCRERVLSGGTSEGVKEAESRPWD